MDKHDFFMNSFFAISIDTYNLKEHIIYCIGYADEFFIGKEQNVCRENRELGEFVFDFSNGIEYFEENRYNVLYHYVTEYNEFIKRNEKIWHYDDELSIKHKAYSDMLDKLKTPMLSDTFFEAQKHLSLNEKHKYSSFEVLKRSYPQKMYDISNDFRMFYIGDTPYIATDFHLFELFRYYLDEIYSAGLFPRKCMNCDSLFLSNKKHGDVLCSDECRKRRKSHNTLAYYRKLSKNEALYNNLYRKWMQRIDRAEEKHTIDSEGIAKLREALKDLTENNRKMANERKKGNVREIDGVPDYESFDKLHHDILMSKDQFLYQLFNSVKTD